MRTGRVGDNRVGTLALARRVVGPAPYELSHRGRTPTDTKTTTSKDFGEVLKTLRTPLPRVNTQGVSVSHVSFLHRGGGLQVFAASENSAVVVS